MTYFLLFVLALLPFYFLLLFLKTRSRRLSASFALYDARDKFVYLIAEGIISEADPVFEYYYARINAILSRAPKIGLDHLIKGMLKSNSEDTEKSIEAAKERARKLYAHKSMDIPEVKEAVMCYLSASRAMILSHSSLMKLMYVAFKHRENFSRFVKSVAPESTYVKAASVVNCYNDDELNSLAAA